MTRRTMITLAAAVALLAGAGAAAAAAGKPGPPQEAPRLGLQAGMHQGYGMGAGGVVMDAAASYIGITETELATARHDGQSLAQIATAHGKTVVGLEQALVSAVEANLDGLVAAGRITSAQAEQMLAHFEAQVQTVATRTATGPLFGRGGGMGLGLGACGGRS